MFKPAKTNGDYLRTLGNKALARYLADTTRVAYSVWLQVLDAPANREILDRYCKCERSGDNEEK